MSSTVQCTGRSRRRAGHGPRPQARAGEERRRRGWGGGCRRGIRVSLRRRGRGGCRRGIRVPCQRLGWDRREAGWLEREKQGRGNEFPLPVSPTPNGDIPTVQCTGRSRRRAGHGCSPDIRPGTDPAPAARAGWRRPKKCLSILCRRRGRGGGCRQKSMGIPAEAQAGWGSRGGMRSRLRRCMRSNRS